MNPLKILHITDLHLDDIHSPNEKLREAFFKEYLNDMYEKISETIGNEIDYLFCTGDFINKGKVENYDHAEKILDHLCLIFKIERKQVSLCIGNHDFKVDDDKVGQSIIARDEFYKIERNFRPDNLIDLLQYYKSIS